MHQSIPLETYKTLEKEFGQAIAEKVTALLDYSFSQADKKIEQIAIHKKLELSKELASKADLNLLRSEMALIEQRLDKKITVWSVILLCAMIILNKDSITLIASLLGLVK